MLNQKTSTKLVGKSLLIAIEFAIKVHLQDLTHMFCFLKSFYIVYKEDVFFLDFMLKIMCHLDGVQEA